MFFVAPFISYFRRQRDSSIFHETWSKDVNGGEEKTPGIIVVVVVVVIVVFVRVFSVGAAVVLNGVFHPFLSLFTSRKLRLFQKA